jgi:choline-phosphate cytidylyltransferase
VGIDKDNDLQLLIVCRIVRDYDKYISRQLKRGTTRQELNVSWLKKGELEFKRTVTDLRDSIRQNWSTTGQELGRDIRQILQPSRPQSPAPGRSREPSQDHGTLRSPTALSHLAHLDVPTSSPAANGSGSGGQQQQRDFATGYALGLVGGVRNWVCLLFASDDNASCRFARRE